MKYHESRVIDLSEDQDENSDDEVQESSSDDSVKKFEPTEKKIREKLNLKKIEKAFIYSTIKSSVLSNS